MSTFTSSTTARAVVPVERDQVWDVLIDPDLVARFTPFIKRIEPVGDDHWVWHMSGLSVLGKGFAATFTERMTLKEGERIEFDHDPPPGAKERAGVHGWYNLTDHEDAGQPAVMLEISLEICIDLPLPRVSGPAVRSTMRGVIATMGDRFSKNLLAHLGVR
ncbi:hypothetical protein GCM10023340_00260 [Nocardioides marinquilinus]|uniref:SRPBCC family protein n=1 Tax=Nocardioides marinquilinus TaxID=1210400 RepID=A0ABP9P4R7_9ACTN